MDNGKNVSQLDPTANEFAATRLPLEDAINLPTRCYTSREWYEREVETIFLKQWLCVGRVDQVAKPGDYFTLRLMGEPLVVVRDDQGNINALSTICRHRWMEVVEGEGNRRSFQCPYHAWTYSLQGKLIGAPEMEKTRHFEKNDCSLPALRTETWEGFIFVNFDPHAKPLAPTLAPLSKRLKNYGLSEMRSTPPLVYEGNWNWKLEIENFMEPYHVLGLHKGSHDPMPAHLVTTEDYNGGYELARGRFAQESGTLWTEDGLNSPFPVIGTLSPEELRIGEFFLIYPTHLFVVLPDSMTYFQTFPDGPDKVTVRITMCFPPSTVERADFEQSLAQAKDSLVFINNQDMWACSVVQRACSSRLAERGRFSHMEKAIWQIDRYVTSHVLGE